MSRQDDSYLSRASLDVSDELFEYPKDCRDVGREFMTAFKHIHRGRQETDHDDSNTKQTFTRSIPMRSRSKEIEPFQQPAVLQEPKQTACVDHRLHSG